MTSFGILVKSYRGDLDSAELLFRSIAQFNVEQIPVWAVVPDEDVDAFTGIASHVGEVLPESMFEQHLVSEPVAGIRPGYINQEIIKVAFWELGLAGNYLPVDSDAVFLREFGVDDFMFSEDVPFTVLLEDRELQVDPDYYAVHWQDRERTLRDIQAAVGLDDARLLTCHGHQVLSRTVLKSLQEDFLVPRNWDYAEMLAHGPYEFSWYNFWLQKSKVIPIELREPYFKVVHSPEQHAELAIRGISMSDIARGYLGVIVNSNFAKSFDDLTHESSRSQTLATYLTWSELAATAGAKVRRSLRSLTNRRGA